MSLITLLTDFGTQDIYVGVMKGTIARIAPQAQIIDLTHAIPPQDIATARFQWMSAYPYFPPGTIHLAVVDPGVGSSRHPIALQMPSGYLIAPDNGLISGILPIEPPIAAVKLTNPQYWRTPNPSNTFHGRDIFAPIAAHLANGVSLLELGEAIDPAALVQLPMPLPQQLPDGTWQGVIQAIDHFGNLITNLRGDLVMGKTWSLQMGDRTFPGCQTYADHQTGEAIALINSENWIEVAIVNGNAKHMGKTHQFCVVSFGVNPNGR
jgi:S-adenosyl-L-methionine hydrolase (adenosine-forming)